MFFLENYVFYVFYLQNLEFSFLFAFKFWIPPYFSFLFIIPIIMNKTELISAIAEKAGLSKESAKKALEAFLSSVEETLAKGEKLTLVGFGTFSVVKKAARTGVNPATKQPIKIPAKNVVKFKAGASLAAKV